MQIKKRYLVYLMILFMAVVFLDQNNVPVPVKLIVGEPIQVDLSLIVMGSIFLGVLMTLGALLGVKRIKKNKERSAEPHGNPPDRSSEIPRIGRV